MRYTEALACCVAAASCAAVVLPGSEPVDALMDRWSGDPVVEMLVFPQAPGRNHLLQIAQDASDSLLRQITVALNMGSQLLPGVAYACSAPEDASRPVNSKSGGC